MKEPCDRCIVQPMCTTACHNIFDYINFLNKRISLLGALTWTVYSIGIAESFGFYVIEHYTGYEALWTFILYWSLMAISIILLSLRLIYKLKLKKLYSSKLSTDIMKNMWLKEIF